MPDSPYELNAILTQIDHHANDWVDNIILANSKLIFALFIEASPELLFLVSLYTYIQMKSKFIIFIFINVISACISIQ